MRICGRLLVFLALVWINAAPALGQSEEMPKPDERFKADILIVVAHPTMKPW
jgi:hypothetical protein